MIQTCTMNWKVQGSWVVSSEVDDSPSVVWTLDIVHSHIVLWKEMMIVLYCYCVVVDMLDSCWLDRVVSSD